MKCPHCSTYDRLYRVRSKLPWYLFPLRLFVVRVYCDSCLITFYRLRVYDWALRLFSKEAGSSRLTASRRVGSTLGARGFPPGDAGEQDLQA